MKLSIDHTACPELIKCEENMWKVPNSASQDNIQQMIIQLSQILKSEVEYNPRKNSFFFLLAQ